MMGHWALKVFRSSPRVIRACKEVLGHNPDEIIILGWSEVIKKERKPFMWQVDNRGVGGRNNKLVVDLETGVFYNSAKEAIHCLNLRDGERRRISSGTHKRLVYVDDMGDSR